MPSGLQAAAFSISDILTGPFLLNVPVYQRPFAWTTEEAGQLLDDLLESAGLDGGSQGEPDYFLGSILLMSLAGVGTPRLSARMAAQEFDIVDGQQRIITLLTLAAVLRDLENDPRGSVARRVAAIMSARKARNFFRKEEKERIHVATRDRAFFDKFISEPGSTLKSPDVPPDRPEACLFEVREYFLSELKDYSAADRTQLFEYMLDRCEVVVILSEDIDRAYRKFIVLNERGKKLQRNDILKADVVSRLASSDLDWAIKDWDETSERLGSDFETFFSHVRAIYGHARPQIVSAVRAVVSEEGGAAPFLKNAFKPLAESYAALRSNSADPREALTPRMRAYLTYLNRLADGDWAPAAMLALRDRRADPQNAEILLGEIDRAAHLLRLLCVGAGRRKRRFADVVEAIRKGGKIDASHPAFAFTRDDIRNIAFHLRDLHKRNQKICKLLLLRLNDEIAGAATPINPDDFTIEHVLPQRPRQTSEWRKWYTTAEERALYTESLGNLVLVPQAENDKARNENFARKKEIFAESTVLPITAGVLDCAEWLPFEVEAREEHLFDVIRKTWRIDLPRSRPGEK